VWRLSAPHLRSGLAAGLFLFRRENPKIFVIQGLEFFLRECGPVCEPAWKTSKVMKNKRICGLGRLTLLALLAGIHHAAAQGMAFTYQGQLGDSGSPANGSYDLQFELFDAAAGGHQVGNTVTNPAVGVTNGLFNTTLDFGSGVFTGPSYWLQLGVRTNNPANPVAFIDLTPLQALAPVPYAIFANTASNVLGALPASQLTGTVPVTQLPAGVLVNNQTGVTLGGTFSGDGSGLTNLNAAQLMTGVIPRSLLPGFQSSNSYATLSGGFNNYALGGYSTVGGGHFNTAEAAWLNETIGGGDSNIANGQGATVGGGESNYANGSVDSTVGGGYNNFSSGAWSFVGGGDSNIANKTYSAVAGGFSNFASGDSAAIGGGSQNQAMGGGATIGGGGANIAGGVEATVGGGSANQASGDYSTVPGGRINLAGGDYSFAAGYNAQATNLGAFVWADSQDPIFASTTANQFSVRAQGGVRFVTAGAGLTLDGQTVLTNGQSGVNLSGSFNGNGAGLNNLNASQITSGTLSSAQLPPAVVLNGASAVLLGGIFDGYFVGTGSALSNLTASQITGTLSPAQLPPTVVTTADPLVALHTLVLSGNLLLPTPANIASQTVGINMNNPTAALDVNGEFAVVEGLGGVRCYLGDDGNANDVQLGSLTSGVTDISFYNPTDNKPMHISCSSISILGGADLAEPFPISTTEQTVSEGDVVVIDENHPGQLKLTDRAYDTRVAGVISGANGINPGIQMQQQGLLGGGKNVALTGRVYVQADISNGPIKPGDLLTTSSTPGRAMRVSDHGRAQGAILGKAMTALSADHGVVLVLVTLQ